MRHPFWVMLRQRGTAAIWARFDRPGKSAIPWRRRHGEAPQRSFVVHCGIRVATARDRKLSFTRQ
jgi:hypothetical protein